jgi:hypothetical protein
MKRSVLDSDATSSDSILSKPEPESKPTPFQKENERAIASADTVFVDVDASSEKMAGQVSGVVQHANGKRDLQNLKSALSTIDGIGPKDELEGLLAVQMIAVHNLAMQCLAGASHNRTTETLDANISRATKLLRTFTMQMEAFGRHRGKISHQTVVGSVNVNQGGQAIVGSVSQTGKNEEPAEDDADKNE